MPRIKGFTPEQKVEHQRILLAERCSMLLSKAHLTKSDVARYLNTSPQSICQQFKNNSITTSVLIAVLTLTDAEPDVIVNMMKVREWWPSKKEQSN